MKIYTKTGDQGQTSLMGAKRLSKNSLRIQSYGEVDELNAVLGLCRSAITYSEIEKILQHLQKDLFILGSDLATIPQEQIQVPRVEEHQTLQLEAWIDQIEKELKPLKKFILPAGHPGACYFHIARTICRRAERSIVALGEREYIGPYILPYINRLSDLLFMMARWTNQLSGYEETEWIDA